MKITSGVIMVGHLASALVGAILASAVITSCTNPTWHNDPKPLQSGVQPANPNGGSQTQPQRLSGPKDVLDGLPGCYAPGWQVLAIECFEGGQHDGQG